MPIKMPKSVSGSSLCMLKCKRANMIALNTTETIAGTYRLKEGIKNPLNKISSHIGDMHVVQKT